MEDRETARMRKYGESKTTRIMMATVPHVTSGLRLRKISGRWIFVGTSVPPGLILYSSPFTQKVSLCVHMCFVWFRIKDCTCNQYRVSQKECAKLREGVPYVKVYRYNPKHLCLKLNGYGDNGQRKVWSSGGSTHCTCQLTTLSMSVLECDVILQQFTSRSL